MKATSLLPIVSFGLFAVAVGCKGGDSSAGASESTAAVPYAKVQEVLTAKCAGCHGAGSPKAGVDLTSFDAVMKGGGSGPIVKAGDPANSELIQVMRGAAGHKKMPPMGDPVPEDQIKTVEAWIQGGAKAS